MQQKPTRQACEEHFRERNCECMRILNDILAGCSSKIVWGRERLSSVSSLELNHICSTQRPGGRERHTETEQRLASQSVLLRCTISTEFDSFT